MTQPPQPSTPVPATTPGEMPATKPVPRAGFCGCWVVGHGLTRGWCRSTPRVYPDCRRCEIPSLASGVTGDPGEVVRCTRTSHPSPIPTWDPIGR
jgi:hypothetical protein